VRDGLLVRNPAKDRARRRIGLGDVSSAGLLCQWRRPSPRDFALHDLRTLSRLVEEPARRVVIKLGVTA
jgi:hypothetical protein